MSASGSPPVPRKLGWILLLALVCALLAAALFEYRRGKPRREAIDTASRLLEMIVAKDPAGMLEVVTLPASVPASSSESAGQGKWIADLLEDEIDAEGLDAMRRHAEFGALAEIFPEEAAAWSRYGGIPVESCVAFRMERGGIRGELVFHHSPAGLRILRCNNVKQMASPNPTS